MLDQFRPIEDAIRIEVPESVRLPIAIVGAGEIVEVAHLPAYAAHGLPIAGIYDQDRARAEWVATKFGIAKVYDSAAEIAADKNIGVVDIAVVPWAQPELAEQMMRAGKHLLCQKPLALETSVAETLVEKAEAAGLQLAVNMQLRFDEGIAAAKAMVEAGWIGEPIAMSFHVHIYTPWENWPWVQASKRLDLNYHTIHYLDATRFVLGDPEAAFATLSRLPGQAEIGDTRSTCVLVYGGERRAVLDVFHKNMDGQPRAEFRIDGVEGSIRGTLGLLYDYPRGRPDTLEIFSRVLPTDGWLPYPVTRRWLPDAFIGPMASLLGAVANGTPMVTAGRDNLGTLRLVDALYRSHETRSVQTL